MHKENAMIKVTKYVINKFALMRKTNVLANQ